MTAPRLSGVFLAALLLLSGCGADGASAPPSSAPAAPETAPPVYTDWSKLTPRQPAEALYGVFEPYQGDALAPRDDYGTLIPYMGAVAFLSNYILDNLPLYGLMTLDGRVVTEPVYVSVTRPLYFSGDAEDARPTPFLLLTEGVPSGENPGSGAERNILAAADGSWVRDCTAAFFPVDATHMALADGSITVIDETGASTAFFPHSALAPYLGGGELRPNWEGEFALQWKDGVGYVEVYDTALEDFRICCYLDAATGAVTEQPPQGFSPPEWSGLEEFTAEGYRYLQPLQDSITGAVYHYGQRADGAQREDVLDADKRVVYSYPVSDLLYSPLLWGGLCSAVEGDAFCYYSAEGVCVFRFPMRINCD